MICKACGVDKEPSDFYTTRGKPSGPCKACKNERSRAWYADNRERHREMMRGWYEAHPKARAEANRKKCERTRALVKETKGTTPCKDCGALLPSWVMDFDHRPDEVKIDDVSRMASRNGSLTQLRREIAKCDVVCGVCHAHRTYCREHGIEWYALGKK